jgi:hypothetical protein
MSLFLNIRKLNESPKLLFLIDGCGAFLTVFLLGIVLPRLGELIGMPQNILCYLSMIACVFVIYSISCYFFIQKKWRFFLKIIAIANLLYCFLTLGLAIILYPSLTIWDIVYFSGEIAIIGSLVFVELLAVYD